MLPAWPPFVERSSMQLVVDKYCCLSALEVLLAGWTLLGGRFVEEEGRGRLGTVEERERDQIAGG